MTAVVPTTVQEIESRVDLGYGTVVKTRLIYVAVTTTATSNTMDLNTYVSGGVNGILGVMMNSLDGATITTAVTWSSTTVTFANHAGSGGVVMVFLVY